MRFIILPLTDARIVFSEDELSHMRKNIDETEVIVHENILVNKRNNLGLTTLPSEETGQFEWTYPVYEYNSNDLNTLLNSEKWMEEKSV